MNRFPFFLNRAFADIGKLIALLFLACSLSGCVALFVAGVGAGAYTYVAGNLEREYRAEHEDVVKASLLALERLQFTLVKKAGDGLAVVIEGARADKTPVSIHVERQGAMLTKVGVRTGQVGYIDRRVSEQVHEYISKRLLKMSEYKDKNLIEAVKTPDESRVPTVIPGTKSNRMRISKLRYVETSAKPLDKHQTQVAEDLRYLNTSQETLYLYFKSKEKEVSTRLHTTLDKVVARMENDPALSLKLIGYTDNLGNERANQQLSKKRANSVRDYLVGKGIAPERIEVEGLGAGNYFASNSSEKLRAMNRRVELHFRKK